MSERIGIAGGGAIASGLACVAAEHGQVVAVGAPPGRRHRQGGEADRAPRRARRRQRIGLRRPRRRWPARRSSSRRSPRSRTRRRRCCASSAARRRTGRSWPRTTSALSVAELARGDRPARALRRPARLQPGPEDGPGRARLPAEADRRRRASGRTGCARRSARRPSRCPTRRASSSTGCCSRSCSTPSRCSRRAGSTPQAIDDCMRLGAGHPMGPLALLDYVGLDVSAAIGARSAPRCPARVDAMIADGRAREEGGTRASTSIESLRKCLAEIEVALGTCPTATNVPLIATPPPETLRPPDSLP